MFPYLEQIQEYSLCVLTPTYHMILNYVNTICGIVFGAQRQAHKEAILLPSMSKTSTTAAFSEDNVTVTIDFKLSDNVFVWFRCRRVSRDTLWNHYVAKTSPENSLRHICNQRKPQTISDTRILWIWRHTKPPWVRRVACGYAACGFRIHRRHTTGPHNRVEA